MKSTAEKLWPFVSDVNRLHKDLGMSPVKQAETTKQLKDGHKELAFTGLKQYEVWEEEPFEWEYPYRFAIRRRYRNGAFKSIHTRVDLIPNANGTRLRYRITAKPRWGFLAYIKTLNLKTFYKSRLKSTLKNYDEWAGRNKLPYQYQAAKSLVRGGRERLNTIEDNLILETGFKNIVLDLVEFIERAHDIDLKHINPGTLAKYWGYDPRKVLKVFFHAVDEGLLNFYWDLYCPQCRTIQQSCKTLSEIHEPIYCSDCRKEFEVNFNQNIQLSFTPNPLIRKITQYDYAFGDPQSKPHIKIQQYVKPGEIRYLKTHLPDGEYRLRTGHSEGTAHIRVGKEGQDTVNIRLTARGLNGESVEINGDPNLIFENSTERNQLIILEETGWNRNTITAAKTTSLQLFRDLFSKEVLRRGEKIAVDNLTIMFTDLLDSTGMYNKEGEEKALGRVIKHFEILGQAIAEEDGAIVKTIGDSVMAVFSNPKQALKAFRKAQEWIADDQRFDSSLRLKAGIHLGNCTAVNLNNRIDYFGSTVNIASRLVDVADENEAVLSEQVSGYEDLNLLLNKEFGNYGVKQTHTSLKGFNNRQFKIQIVSLDQPALRLVI